MSEESKAVADAQSRVVLHNLPDLLDGTPEQVTAAASAMLRTVTSPGHFSGLAMGVSVVGAEFLKRALPAGGDGMYAIEQIAPHEDSDPKLNAVRVLAMIANGDNETASEITWQMDQGDEKQSAVFLAAVLTNARGMFQMAKAAGTHLAPEVI